MARSLFIAAFIFLVGSSLIPLNIQAFFENFVSGTAVYDLELQEDSRGEILWAGTYGCGLIALDTNTQQILLNYRHSDGLVSNTIYAIAIDTDGSIWLGSPEGVSHFDQVSFKTYTVNDGLVENGITAIAIQPDDSQSDGGIAWIGTQEQGVSRFDGSSWSTFQHDPNDANSLCHNSVSAIVVDNNQHIWFGTAAGASHLDPTTDTWNTYKHDPNVQNSLTGNDVSTIHIDPDDSMWFGTFANGVSHFDGTTWTNFLHDCQNNNCIAGNQIRGVAVDLDSTIWFAVYYNGL